jgi:hypothetical protein
MDPAYKREKKALMSEFKKISQKHSDLKRFLDLCELTQQWQKAIGVLKQQGRLHGFVKILEDNN